MTTRAKPTLGADLTSYRTEKATERHIKVTTREKSRSVQMWRLRPNASPAMRRSEGNGVPVDLIIRCLGALLGMSTQRRMT